LKHSRIQMDNVAGKQMDTSLDSVHVAGQEIDSLAAKEMDSVAGLQVDAMLDSVAAWATDGQWIREICGQLMGGVAGNIAGGHESVEKEMRQFW
jgi:hypothetical protein